MKWPSFLRFGKRGEARSSGASLGDMMAWAGGNLSGVVVTEKSALTLTAAFACVNVIATDVSCLPLRVYKRRTDGGRDEATGHPAYPLLKWTPDGETTPMRARQATMAHTLGWGNGYQEIERDGADRPIGIHRLEPNGVTPKRRVRDKGLFYQLANGNTLRPRNVLHYAMLGYDGLTGYSPVKLARQAIGLGLAQETQGAALYGNGSTPRGYLTKDGNLSKEAAARLREQFERMHRGAENAHRLMVLEEGLKWNTTSFSPEDAQFLASRQFQVIEVCRIYRVPPNKVMDYTQAHLSNIEEANIDYLNTTVMPWCESIEQELNLKLLTAQERADGYYIEHTLAALLRGDMKNRALFYTKLRDLGVLTPNIICQLENLNPAGPAGDVRLVPMNLVSLEHAGQDPKPSTVAPEPPADGNP